MQMFTETISPTCFRLIQDLSNLPFTQDFYLVGGTSLALQIGHRTSIDLDFFSTQTFNPSSWPVELDKVGAVTNLQVRENNIVGAINGVKIEYLHFAYPPKFPLLEWEGIKLMSAMDIGLFKILAIIGRNRKKDIVDLFFIDQHIADLDQVIHTFATTYDAGDVNLLKQLELLFDDQEIEKSSMPMMLVDFDWNSAYKHVKTKLTKAITRELGI
jgi:hypothetical protein